MLRKTLDVLKGLISADKKRLLAAEFAPWGTASYSQCGEDRIIDFFLGNCGIVDATYIDIGASHPMFGNNTYRLYRRGLRGVCVDPTPGLPALYKAYRPDDVFLAKAVVPGDELETKMLFFAQSTVNTINVRNADQLTSFGYGPSETRPVPSTNLQRLCDLHKMTTPDVLSLDIEGLDLAVLSSLDYDHVRPKLICVEVVRYRDDKSVYIDQKIEDFLLDVGYIKYADTFINQLFADKIVLSKIRLL